MRISQDQPFTRLEDLFCGGVQHPWPDARHGEIFGKQQKLAETLRVCFEGQFYRKDLALQT